MPFKLPDNTLALAAATLQLASSDAPVVPCLPANLRTHARSCAHAPTSEERPRGAATSRTCPGWHARTPHATRCCRYRGLQGPAPFNEGRAKPNPTPYTLLRIRAGCTLEFHRTRSPSGPVRVPRAHALTESGEGRPWEIASQSRRPAGAGRHSLEEGITESGLASVGSAYCGCTARRPCGVARARRVLPGARRPRAVLRIRRVSPFGIPPASIGVEGLRG
ncbi:hypothetical protein FKP32DRAFT_1592894 [Trametes sanguinea]|nr:hypothetical protein FKP32DRAFT_1592894 [Trametes sanguinea]